jgi:hypothetical protein
LRHCITSRKFAGSTPDAAIGIFHYNPSSGPDSSVGIATGYGLDDPGIESQWGLDFPHLSRPALGPTQPPVQSVPGLSPGVESGRGVTLTPHPFLVPRSKNRVELCLYSPP